MRRLFFLALSSAILVAAAPPHKSAPKVPAPPSAEAKLIQSCDAHKFETVVDTVVDGHPGKSKVKLCGVEGQSDAEWIGTLKDAIRKLETNKTMAPATRDQIVAAIKSEIARLSIVSAPPPVPAPAPAPAQPVAKAEPLPPLSRDYSPLPALPPAAAPEASPPVAEPQSQPVAPKASTPVAPPPVPVAMPKLTIRCEIPGDLGGAAPCAEFERETILTISASSDVPPGTTLQFVRNGREQSELSLDGVTKRNPLRSTLPASVCAGFGAGRLELRVVANGSTVRSDGPYSLRCY